MAQENTKYVMHTMVASLQRAVCLSEVEKGSGPEGQSLIPKCLLNPRCCVFLALKNAPVNFSVKTMPAGDVWCFLLHFPFC